jgi:hypothetical protein
MWINGLKQLRKPVAHLHTQYNRDIPWATIDMDFMNMNQAAHGDREHGFIWSRMRLNRKVIVGFWQEKSTQEKLGAWARAASAWADWQTAKFIRFGDNMREVAVTEGDKVSAQIKFGFAVNGYGVGDLVKVVNEATEKAASATNPSAKPRASNSVCGRFSRLADSRASRRHLKICTASCNCPASRRNVSWRTATALLAKATGKQPRSSAR